MNPKVNVLILASYCGEDDLCCDINPCLDCLCMCNTAVADIKEVGGQIRFEYNLISQIRKKQDIIKDLMYLVRKSFCEGFGDNIESDPMKGWGKSTTKKELNKIKTIEINQ